MDLLDLLRRFRFPPDRRAAVELAKNESAGRDGASRKKRRPKTIDLAGVYRVEGTNPNGSKYRGMVALAQDNDQFDFTWWIGKDVFRGTGHFAGKMLVVNWGDKTRSSTPSAKGAPRRRMGGWLGGETLEPSLMRRR